LPGLLDSYAISPVVNKVVNDSPDLIERLPPEQLAAQATAANLPKRTARKPKDDDRQASLF
jgi:hypothetical protein